MYMYSLFPHLFLDIIKSIHLQVTSVYFLTYMLAINNPLPVPVIMQDAIVSLGAT